MDQNHHQPSSWYVHPIDLFGNYFTKPVSWLAEMEVLTFCQIYFHMLCFIQIHVKYFFPLTWCVLYKVKYYIRYVCIFQENCVIAQLKPSNNYGVYYTDGCAVRQMYENVRKTHDTDRVKIGGECHSC